MKHTLKILIPILLILALLIGACWFFLIARRDLTESVFTYWGNHFYNNGRYGRAITCYKLAMHFAPKDAELAIWLSNAYKRSGNYTKAEYTLVNAITQSPDAADLYIALSKTYVEQDKLLDAETMLGRKRHIPELKSSNGQQRAFGERTAMNHPMQGSAADIIKMAMNEVQRRLLAEDFEAQLMIQVHDELDFSVPAGEVERLAAMVKEVMEGVVSLKVPLIADVSWGPTWAEAH